MIPFRECLARPGSLLTDHLIAVRNSVEFFLRGKEKEIILLSGLSGICHDLAKSHYEWQMYIRGNRKKGPNHSQCGAFLFSFFGYHLLNQLKSWEKWKLTWLWFTRDIADHHGVLHHLYDDNWLKIYDWEKFDLRGIKRFMEDQYEELRGLPLDENVLVEWIDIAGEWIDNIKDDHYEAVEENDFQTAMEKIQTWRIFTTGLIAGDRFDVKQIQTTWINNDNIQQYKRQLEEYLQKNASSLFSVVRIQAQKNIMDQLIEFPDHKFFVLEMPTGYGKTITSLKMALWFCENHGMKKIVYVAPYLSILEQTSTVIENALNETTLEHHSLALLDDDEVQRVSQSQLAMESWAHSFVCTSFHQFIKALFPKRSQDVLRRSFLKDTVIIIDEPQIFEPEIWNLLLFGLVSLSRLLHLKIIFLSATMPPFHGELTTAPVILSVKAKKEYNRYKLLLESRKDENDLAVLMQEKERPSQAAILNTIEDAYRVYKNINCENRYLLHGLMIPVHKKIMIEKIREKLKGKNRKPLYVISTQIIEAGVDMSFQSVFRALSILPSIIQAGGRVNRNMETQMGVLYTFPFFRQGEKDTRSAIYPKNLQKITDMLLSAKEEWLEEELQHLTRKFYAEMFRQNTYEAGLLKIKEAYAGNWEALSGTSPFKNNVNTLPIFIPLEIAEEDKKYLPEKLVQLMKKFSVNTGLEIYEKYADNTFMKNLEFEERKKFMILFHYFVINIPVNKALKTVSKDDFLKHRVPILKDCYSYELGFNAGFEDMDDSLW